MTTFVGRLAILSMDESLLSDLHGIFVSKMIFHDGFSRAIAK